MRTTQLLSKLLPIIFLLHLSLFSFSQVKEQWVARYGPENSFNAARDLAVDIHGNVYVTGESSIDEEVSSYAVVKYDASGTELWVRRYDGPGGFDYAVALAVDNSGNVYVTGNSQGTDGTSDIATIKYDKDGNQLWVRRYSSSMNEETAEAIAIDVSGNVYITGFTRYNSVNYDYVTIKYSSDGSQLWAKTYNGPANDDDQARDIAVDALGNAYVTGFSKSIGLDYDYVTIKYDPNGNELWIARYNNIEGGADAANALTVDETGNVYVTGYSKGTQSLSDYDYATIKYDTDGKVIWISRYNGLANGYDEATAIAVDGKGNVYVTGKSQNQVNNSYDFVTIKYDQNGNQLWTSRYDGADHFDDISRSIAVDEIGNVYVTGGSGTDNGLSVDYATIKYGPDGSQLWVKRYNGTGNGPDEAEDIALDADGNVLVTGGSAALGSGWDFATIKYVQIPAAPLVINAVEDKTVYYGYGSNCSILSATVEGGMTPYTYNWSPGGATSSSIKVCPTATTTYTITITDAVGNTASDQVTVNVVDVRCGNKEEKVLVCHNGEPVCVAASSVSAHLKHGDQLGNCRIDASITNKKSSNNDDALATAEHLKISAAPNPFNNITHVYYDLPFSGKVSIKVYNAVGQEVATLFQADQKAGMYSTSFNASGLSKGIYIYRMMVVTKNNVYYKEGKMILTK